MLKTLKMKGPSYLIAYNFINEGAAVQDVCEPAGVLVIMRTTTKLTEEIVVSPVEQVKVLLVKKRMKFHERTLNIKL